MTLPGLKVVSLFAGAGGLDIAFCNTGRVANLFSTDSNPVFLDTIVRNLPKHYPEVTHSHLAIDARDLTGSCIESLTGPEIDLVIGGPPCDDFTSQGKQQGFAGEKGPLIFEFSRIVKDLRPSAFLFENVPNLESMFNEGYRNLLSLFHKYGYETYSEILSASAFGAPTMRKRLFISGFRRDRFPEPWGGFPEPSHSVNCHEGELFQSLLPAVTMRMALANLPDVTDKKSCGKGAP